MASKEQKRKELEEQYKKHLEEIEAEEDDGNGDDDIIILRGNARKQFLASMEKAGYSLGEAKEEAEDIEEELDADGNPVVKPEGEAGDPEAEKGKAKGKKADKAVEDKTGGEEDPKPPPRSRYFGGGR